MPAATYLEAYKDVSHLLLGQSVPKALQAGSHGCLPTQLACKGKGQMMSCLLQLLVSVSYSITQLWLGVSNGYAVIISFAEVL